MWACICHACEVKSAMNRLAIAKENAVRAEMGLPPLRPWYIQWLYTIKEKVSLSCKETLCPCLIYDPNRHLKRRTAYTCFGRLLIDGTYENQVMKSICGCLGGFIVTLLWFALMIFYMKYAYLPATVTCIILGLVLSIGLAYSERVRCLTLLTLPNLFSSKGRSVLLATCFVLALNGPMRNFSHNVHVMSETASCGQEVTKDATKQVVDAALAPVKDVLANIRAVLQSLAQLALKLRDAFIKIRNLFKEVLAAVSRVLLWLVNMVKVCNKNMGGPYKICSDAFNSAVADCRNQLGFMNFMCEIATVVKYICHVARIGELLCSIPALIKKFLITHITKGLHVALKDIYDVFYFNVTLKYHYDIKLVQSKTFADIREDIQAEIEDRIRPLFSFASVNHVGLVFMMGWLVLKAVQYKRKFLTKDRYDNFYITWHLMDIDVKRKKFDKEIIFPLWDTEKPKYIKTVSIRLAKNERKKLIIGLVFLGASGLHLSFQIACDYGLYWLLSMIRIHGELKTHENVPAHLKMHVQGEGILSDIYRAMITQFDPVQGQQISIDTTPCLPNPSPPDYDTYIMIAYIYATCILLVFTQSYGLRLRHLVAGCYHPKRAKARAVWLYNHILRRRVNFLTVLRRNLRKKRSTEEAEEYISIFSWLSAKSPIVGKILTKLGLGKFKHCLSCGKSGKLSDRDDFMHCDNYGCNAVYCLQCFADLNNLCTVCMNPLDYGDYSDFSEERDSSDMDVRKRMLRRPRKKEEESTDSSSDSSDDLDYSYQDRKDLDGESSSESEEDTRRTRHPGRRPVETVSVDIFGSTSDSDSVTDSSSSSSNEESRVTHRQAINRS